MRKKNTKSQVENSPRMVVGLDIGTTKIVMVMGYLRDDGKVEICGSGRSYSDGVEYGLVFNVKQTTDAICRAKAELEENVGLPVKEVYVGVAGRHVKSKVFNSSLNRINGLDTLVTEEEIKKMTTELEHYSIPGCDVISVIPQYYDVDGIITQTPVGTLGQSVVGTYQIITGDTQEVKKIKYSVEGAELELKDLMLEPFASAIACLTDEEKKNGVALVDIGGGTTDVIVFHSGVPLFIKVIPVGGKLVTNDIMSLGISYEQAEELKIKHGTCYVDNANKNNVITIPEMAGYESSKSINEYRLAQIINARVGNDIFCAVKSAIDNSGYADKIMSIVLTGGGSLMRDVVSLSEYVLQHKSRIGFPEKGFVTVNKDLKDPSCSTALGLLRVGCFEEATPYSGSNVEEDFFPNDDEKETPSKIGVSLKGFMDRCGKWFRDITSAEEGGID